MNTRRRRAFVMLALALWAPAWQPPRAAAAAATSDATLVAAAHLVVALHGAIGRGFRPLMRRARAVLIAPAGRTFPSLLLLRTLSGWSEPAFFAPGALTSTAPALLLVMSDRATDAILRQAGLPLDGPGALTTAALKMRPAAADLLLWSADPRARPAPDGPHQDDAANSAFYGHPRNAADIVGFTPPELRSSKLRAALAD